MESPTIIYHNPRNNMDFCSNHISTDPQPLHDGINCQSTTLYDCGITWNTTKKHFVSTIWIYTLNN